MINRIFHTIALGTLLLGLLAGCAKEAKVAAYTIGPSRLPPTIVEKLADAGKISTIRALIDAQVKFRGSRKRFDIAVVAKAPDWIRMEFVDQLTGTVMSIVSTPEQMVYADSSGFYFYSGDERDQEFKKLTRLPWTPEETIRIFMGGLPIPLSPDAEYVQDSTGRYWIADGAHAVSWDNERSQLSYMERSGKRGGATVQYSEYREERAIVFPTIINVDLRRPKTKINLNYKDVNLNSTVGSDVFSQVNFVSYEREN